MLYAVIAILMLFWLIGMATSILMGGLIHVFLIIAVFVLFVNVMCPEGA